MKKIKHFIYRIARFLTIHVCRILPLQDKVIFDNFRRDGFGDDPKYIAQELAKSGAKLIWCYMEKPGDYPDYITPVRTYSLKFFYHLCTAKVWIDNVRGTFWIKKRPKQFYVQTWHGTLSLKKVEMEAPTIPEGWKRASIKDGELTDLMYTNNDFQKWKYENIFWYQGPVVKCDVPRLSILINPSIGLKKKVLDYFNIEGDPKIVLYAPTFRKDYNMSHYIWNYNNVLNALDEKFNCHFIMLLRLHPIVAQKCDTINYSSTIINATNYPDMQELLSVSNIQINDYSSSMFDFGYLKRPLFLLAKDVEQYSNSDRGMEFTFDELPFPLSKSETELIQNIQSFDLKKYQMNVEEFYNKIGFVDSGKGAEMVANMIIERLKYGK